MTDRPNIAARAVRHLCRYVLSLEDEVADLEQQIQTLDPS